MGEYQVHQVRYHMYQPSSITALAYDKSKRLAAARADGTIEIWNVFDNWFQEQIVPFSDGVVDNIIWCNGILFSSGQKGFLYQYDLYSFSVKHKCSSNSVTISSLCTNEEQTIIAAGTVDGYVVFYMITEDGPQFINTSSKQDGEIFCIAWCSENKVVVGGSIGYIYVWDSENRHLQQRITVSQESFREQSIIWTLDIAKDFTIVAGDSRGVLSFWNGQFGTLNSRFDCQKADILSLAMSKDKTAVYCGGIQPEIAEYKLTESQAGNKKWVRGEVRHGLHTHDIKVMTVVNNYLVSGGEDCKLVITDLSCQSKNNKAVMNVGRIPHKPVAKLAKKVRCILLQYNSCLELWKLGSTAQSSNINGELLQLSENTSKLLELKYNKGDDVIDCCISDDAQWIAYTTSTTLRLYHITFGYQSGSICDLEVKSIRHPLRKQLACCLICFTADKELVAVKPCGTSIILKISSDGSFVRDAIIKPPKNSESGCHLLCVSDSGRYFATADHDSVIHVYALKKKKHLCTLPKCEEQPTAISLHPRGAQVIVAYSNHKIMEYDIKAESYTIWCRQLYDSWQNWLHKSCKIKSIYYQPGKEHLVHVIVEDMLIIINQTQRVPSGKNWFASTRNKSKFKHNDSCFHFCTKFRYLLYVDVLEDDSLVVVERSPLAIMESLPATFAKKHFGT